MKKVLRNENGITLVALIFTIIVMLILVGASVAIATDGGLFTRAHEAADKTQLEADRETLLSEVVGAYDVNIGEVDYTILNNRIGEIEFTEENEVYISKSGNMFSVDQESGRITYLGKQ